MYAWLALKMFSLDDWMRILLFEEAGGKDV
jgi:hypothetical protein